MNKPSKQEISYSFNNLVCVVKALEGRYTTIDLRGESCITGMIVHVDGFMNVDMEDCVYYNSRGNTYPFNNFFVKKRNIMYVHIPDGLSATKLATKQISEQRLNKCQVLKPTGKELFRIRRVERYQQKTVQEMASTSKRY